MNYPLSEKYMTADLSKSIKAIRLFTACEQAGIF